MADMQENRHTYKMGIIGNCAFMSHIDDTANIVWQCMPKFDSNALFSSLLDESKGGHFYIRPQEKDFTCKQYYLDNTNVLCTEFSAASGSFRVTDFAPRFYQYERFYKPLMLFRRIEKLSGNPKVVIACEPKDDYGLTDSKKSFGSNHIRYLGFAEQVRLTSNLSLNYIAEQTPFVLTQIGYLALTWGVPLEGALESTAEDFLRKTIEYWHHWVENLTLPSKYSKEIIRSSLALKLHQYEDTGAIIAAGTTSLPEHDGSGRNWDYRYCWLRDSYYTLSAFSQIGHFREMKSYSHFIQNILLQTESHIQPLYSILGHATIEEKELSLSGYLGTNKPVRTGNDAYRQIQNDVYGQMILSLLPLYVDERFLVNHSNMSIDVVHTVLGYIERKLEEPDAGIWELRGRLEKHCYTYLFHWAGCMAAKKIALRSKDKVLLKKAESLAKLAAIEIEKFYDPKKEVYAQTQDHSYLDASLLQLITMNYLDPSSERAAKHLKALEKELGEQNGMFFRYKHADDFGKPESSFVICSFWYIEALACVGRVDEAMKHFDSMLSFSNHLGLLSEDLSPIDASQWGNFPQTYSHVGLINAAFRIAKKLDLPEFI